MTAKCYVLMYFHMHQPYYKDLNSGVYKMPWVRLHALRNYADFPALQLAYPDISVSYNLVPSMVEQILDYADGATDEFETVSRIPAEELTESEKRFILANFFQLHKPTQIDPVARYRELLALKGSQNREVSTSALNSFTSSELRDLQVLFNLAWTGWKLRDDPQISALVDKGRNYTEEDKMILLDRQRDFLCEVLTPYKQAVERNQAELTVSPYFHPILPLLCNTDSAREALPHIALPKKNFSYPQDASDQIAAALDYHQRIFDNRPLGMWPSEGSISNEACAAIRESGITWLASDETVLAHSLSLSKNALSPAQKYSPWQLQTKSGPLTIFFRDTEFSDLIGFTYQHWSPERAVEDLVKRLRHIADSHSGDTPPVIPIILDGENAWGYYTDNGREFLETVYEQLGSTEWIETTTPSKLMASSDFKPNQLDSIVAGSWIYGTLSTWIGHDEKNRAWDLLTDARNNYNQNIKKPDLSENQREKARKELHIAEGSDWFWWYGDDHETAYAAEFDELFRSHLANIYSFLKLDPPSELLKSIKNTRISSGIEPPMRLISPEINGYENKYAEWINAGLYFARGGAEMMHRTSGLVESIRFGFDVDNIYIRIDGRRPFTEQPLAGYGLTLKITAPRKAVVYYDFASAQAPVLHCDDMEYELKYGEGSHLEIAIPWDKACKGNVFAFYLLITRKGEEIEQHPRGDLIKMERHDANYNAIMWRV